MTDQPYMPPSASLPVPKWALPADAVQGTVSTDPGAIAAALRDLQQGAPALAEQPLRYSDAERNEDEPAEDKVKVEDLKPHDEKPAIPRPVGREFPAARAGGAPAWAVVPSDMTVPRGRVVFFMRFRASMTNTPKKGIPAPDMFEPDGSPVLYRQLIVWAISVGDKKFAAGRSMGDPIRFSDELVKSMIRAVDGKTLDMTDASLDVWWDEVGEKVRSLVQRAYNQLHNLKAEELDHFLEHCVESRSGA